MSGQGYQTFPPVGQLEAIAIIAGRDWDAASIAAGDDEQLVVPGTNGVTFHTRVVGPGANARIDTPLAGDDQYESAASAARIPPATHPLLADTDADGVGDFTELDGYLVGLSIRDGGNRRVETAANGDDVQTAFFHNPVKANGIVILPGPNGLIDSTAAFDEVPPTGDDIVNLAQSVVTDPLRRDTDGDLVTDGRERTQSGDPTDPLDGLDTRDSDQDGLTDSEEADLGWPVTVVVNFATTFRVVKSSPSLPDSDLDGLPDLIERDILTDPNSADTNGDGLTDFDEFADFGRYAGLEQRFPRFFVNGSASAQYGTDPSPSDTDQDDLTDHFELLEGYRLLVPGESSFRHIFTNPLERDTDLDGASDIMEQGGVVVGNPPVSDATDPDTDKDGRTDGDEIFGNTDPLVPDIRVTVRFPLIRLNGSATDGSGPIWNTRWTLRVAAGAAPFPGEVVSTQEEYAAGSIFPFFPTCPGGTGFANIGGLTEFTPHLGQDSYTIRSGQSLVLSGELLEIQTPCTSTSVTVGCRQSFLRSFTFNELLQGAGRAEVLKLTPQFGTCPSADLAYEVVAN